MDGQTRRNSVQQGGRSASEIEEIAGRGREDLTVVSLFSGAGGLDLGLEAAGWRTLAQVEMDADCVGTLQLEANRRAVQPRIVHGRIEDVCPDSLRRHLGLGRGELSLLAGGPPCQPFTTSGLRQAINDRRASSLFPAYFKFVDEFRPRALLVENVDGMLSAALRHRPLARRGKNHPAMKLEEQKGSFLRWFLQELVDRGYSMAWGVAEAADYGVPQLRQRAIVVGIRGKEPCYLPMPQFGYPGLPKYRTLRSALAGVKDLGAVQPLSKRKQEVYALIPAGGNWRSLSEGKRKETMGAAYVADGGKSGWWRRLSWTAPAPTILGMPDHSSTALVHPDEIRCISVNECAALQTFPVHVRFAGSSRSQYQQIGNAVPVFLAKALGEHVRDFLGGKRAPPPPAPVWRQLSANRRIGTHGWVGARSRDKDYVLNVHVRSDHIWATEQSEDAPA